MASVNPFNLSDSEEEAERGPNETVDTERSPSDGAPGPPGNPFSPPADAEPPALPLSGNRTSPSGEGICVSASAPTAMAGTAEARISVDGIAAQLLKDQYILTALEFHTELLEAGRELPRLRDYFSNPGNFERQSGTPPAKDQVELDEVVYAWNDHRIRSTNSPRAPSGRPTIMHAVPNLYGVPNFLQPVSPTKLEICLEECYFKDFPCDVDVFHLCTELMSEHRLVMPDDVYEITNLYVKLRQMISDGLRE